MSEFLRARRTWFALFAIAALASALAIPPVVFADLPGGCDFAPTGSTAACVGPLSGSTFAGGDGNLLTSPTTYGTTDWENAPNFVKGIDLTSGSTDNSFGQGTKEDNAAVSVVTGSIPPNKSDLTRFYVGSEFVNGSNFLYLAWERTNVLGSANMDFEINQKTQPDLTTAGPKTLNRTAGDLLVTYDFNNGGGRPALGLLTWVTTGSTSQCFSSNSLPCWGNPLSLNGTDSEAAVNNLDAVTDPIGPNAPRSLPALTFGEAAINLTAAGIFPAATCKALGSVFLKSRASASFGAEVKDFVAPVPVNITNCGSVTIIKNTDPRGINQPFTYASSLSGTCSPDTSPVAFTLNDGAALTNTETCTNVPAGTYTVLEGAEPTGFVLESLNCTADSVSGSTGTQHATDSPQADITLNAGGSVTCTYVNKLQLGAIKITKTSSKAAATPLSGAEFSITGPSYSNPTVTTLADGTVCVDNLVFGDYTVTETKAPGGYKIDNPLPVTKTVNTNANCLSNTSGELTYTFTDTPLTDLTITVNSEVTGGTKSVITCTDASNVNIGNSPQPASGMGDPETVTANGLTPGTYTCTVMVDP